MANLVLTECGFLVPPNRVCFGSPGYKEQGLCENCAQYAEKQKSQVLTRKGGVFASKIPNIQHHGRTRVVQQAFAVTVEASAH